MARSAKGTGVSRLKASIAVAAGLILGLPIGFVLSPDPTGAGALLVGLVASAVVAAGVYVAL